MTQVVLERARPGAADRGAGAASVERVVVGERVTMFRTPKSRKW